MKKSHQMVVGAAVGIGLLGLGGAAIATPMSGDSSASPSASPTVTATTNSDELKKLYDPIIAAEEKLVKEIEASAAKATGAQKEHLTRMKERADKHLQRLKDIAAGKVTPGEGKGQRMRDGRGDGKGRGDHGWRHHRDGRGPGGQSPTATPSK